MNRMKLVVAGAGLGAAALLAGAGPALADPAGDLANRKSEWSQIQSRMEAANRRIASYLERSKRLREMDKTELDGLITQICRLDIARNDDEADRLAKSLTDKIVENVRREFDSLDDEADDVIGDEAEDILNDAKSLRNTTDDLLSYDEVKSETQELLEEMSDQIDDFTEDAYQKFSEDYRTLSNLKDGLIQGSNNPRIRAAIEYGKEKHRYNQQICEEKELVLSSGRLDCVSFNKDACVVWEFKPDTYSESDAKSQAKRYLRDVQDKFKDDSRALANCKKDSDGKPIFEARGVTYPACR